MIKALWPLRPCSFWWRVTGRSATAEKVSYALTNRTNTSTGNITVRDCSWVGPDLAIFTVFCLTMKQPLNVNFWTIRQNSALIISSFMILVAVMWFCFLRGKGRNYESLNYDLILTSLQITYTHVELSNLPWFFCNKVLVHSQAFWWLPECSNICYNSLNIYQISYKFKILFFSCSLIASAVQLDRCN